MISPSEAAAVKDAARALGFDLVAFTNVEVDEGDRDFFVNWCREGRAGDMAWLSREPERRASPKTLLSEALGLITLGVSYFQGPLPEPPPVPAGRVARYAWGEDYHDVLLRRLEVFRGELARLFPGLLSRSALDAQPLLERAFARRGGLGFFGKNTNIIAPRAGSWIFLTELIVNLELPPDAPAPQGCGGCVKCSDACPTDALAVPYRLDARECIAYHTIENRGWVPAGFRPKMGNWIFGCDDCQDVCPFNARAKETAWPEFGASRGVGAWLRLEEVLALRTDAAFKDRFRGTPLTRPKRAGFLRNACIAAGNAADPARLRGALAACLAEDPEPVVRGHAAWALGRAGERAALEKARANDPDPRVRDEAAAALEAR